MWTVIAQARVPGNWVLSTKTWAFPGKLKDSVTAFIGTQPEEFFRFKPTLFESNFTKSIPFNLFSVGKKKLYIVPRAPLTRLF